MKSVVLVVLDGWGIGQNTDSNPIYLATPKNYLSLLENFPNTQLEASGEAVGLPKNEAGNTEVGHLNLGAGRVVYQDLLRINKSIEDRSFFQNESFLQGVDHLKKTNGRLHLLGLVGDGVVHASIEHLFALLDFTKINGIKDVFIHAITDGRDSPPKSALDILARIEQKIKQAGIGKIASVIGRYFAMDRDRRWDRTEKAYDCLTLSEGKRAKSYYEAVTMAYEEGKSDEFIMPTIIEENGSPIALIENGDMVIFYNFRIDRPKQLTRAFVLENFERDANSDFDFDPYAVKYYKTHIPKFEEVQKPFFRRKKLSNLFFITMTGYGKSVPTKIAFPTYTTEATLGEVISQNNLKQLRLAESEKERFVTYYFNGQTDHAFKNEDRIIVPSPKVATYDIQPQMSSPELTSILLESIRSKNYSLILVNIANADMVGHTGSIEACKKAVDSIDTALKSIVDVALEQDVTVLITADHGNIEQKIDPVTQVISTEHTTNSVPFIAINKNLQGKKIELESGSLADIAPTILYLLELQKPDQMTGRNLLEGTD